MKRERERDREGERERERKNILLEIIPNSTLVLTKIMKKKKREKSRVVMWVKD